MPQPAFTLPAPSRLSDEHYIGQIMRGLPCVAFPGREILMAGEISKCLRIAKPHFIKLIVADKVPLFRPGKEATQSALRLTISDYRAWIASRLVRGSGLTLADLAAHEFLQAEHPEIPREVRAAERMPSLKLTEVHGLINLSPSQLCNDCDTGHLPLMDLALSKERRWLRLPRSIYTRYVAHGFARGAAYANRPTERSDPRQLVVFSDHC